MSIRQYYNLLCLSRDRNNFFLCSWGVNSHVLAPGPLEISAWPAMTTNVRNCLPPFFLMQADTYVGLGRTMFGHLTS